MLYNKLLEKIKGFLPETDPILTRKLERMMKDVESSFLDVGFFNEEKNKKV